MKQQLNRIRLTAGRVADFTCPADKTQAFLWDTDSPTLALRVTPTGRKTYVFESRLNGSTLRINIGTVADWPIGQARAKASALKVMIDAGTDPRELERQQQATKEAEKATVLQNQTYTLEKLLNAYCDYLKSLGRISHSAARSIFKVHVLEPCWHQGASAPTPEADCKATVSVACRHGITTVTTTWTKSVRPLKPCSTCLRACPSSPAKWCS